MIIIPNVEKEDSCLNCPIWSLCWDNKPTEDISKDRCPIVDLAVGVIKAEPIKHGRWIKMSDTDGVYWACSECGEDIPRVAHFNRDFDLFPHLESINKTNYCPNCGADMRGGENE